MRLAFLILFFPALVFGQSAGLMSEESYSDITIDSVRLSISNKYVDITFNDGVYANAGRITPVTSSNFSITNFSSGGVTNIAIAGVKRNRQITDGAAASLIGGEYTVRVFLTLTGTPNSTETFTVQCTNIYGPHGNVSSPVTGTISLVIAPVFLLDYIETATVTTEEKGISAMTDVMGLASQSQSTLNNKPIDGTDFVAFNRSAPNYFTGADVGTFDFQTGDAFTVLIKRLNSEHSGTSGSIVSDRASGSGAGAGWWIRISGDNSLHFGMSDGTNVALCDYDDFSGTGEASFFFVNDGAGNLDTYDDTGSSLATVSTAGVSSSFSYTGINFFLGRRDGATGDYFYGYWEKIAIYDSELTADQMADIVANY